MINTSVSPIESVQAKYKMQENASKKFSDFTKTAGNRPAQNINKGVNHAKAQARLSKSNIESTIEAKNNKDAQLKQVAQEFTGFFISQIFSPIFDSINVAPPFGGSHAEKIWQSRLMEEYGKMAGKQNNLGFGDLVYKTLKKINA